MKAPSLTLEKMAIMEMLPHRTLAGVVVRLQVAIDQIEAGVPNSQRVAAQARQDVITLIRIGDRW